MSIIRPSIGIPPWRSMSRFNGSRTYGLRKTANSKLNGQDIGADSILESARRVMDPPRASEAVVESRTRLHAAVRRRLEG